MNIESDITTSVHRRFYICEIGVMVDINVYYIVRLYVGTS